MSLAALLLIVWLFSSSSWPEARQALVAAGDRVAFVCTAYARRQTVVSPVFWDRVFLMKGERSARRTTMFGRRRSSVRRSRRRASAGPGRRPARACAARRDEPSFFTSPIRAGVMPIGARLDFISVYRGLRPRPGAVELFKKSARQGKTAGPFSEESQWACLTDEPLRWCSRLVRSDLAQPPSGYAVF